jgi:hypothetical protein
LGCCITVDDGGLRLFKLVRYFHEDGYSVILENADVMARPDKTPT